MKLLNGVLLIIMTGCGEPAVRVRIVRCDHFGNPTAHWFVLKAENTVLEEVATQKRFIVPGVLGEVGDEFNISADGQLH